MDHTDLSKITVTEVGLIWPEGTTGPDESWVIVKTPEIRGDYIGLTPAAARKLGMELIAAAEKGESRLKR